MIDREKKSNGLMIVLNSIWKDSKHLTRKRKGHWLIVYFMIDIIIKQKH